MIYHKLVPSPVGKLTLVATDKSLIAVLWEEDDPKRVRLSHSQTVKNHAILQETEKQLREYFAGKRRKFSLPLQMNGTPFQVRVWKGLEQIPFGKRISYSELALKIGNSNACRAVGGANGRNPISIIVPCHRVVGASGKLTGFAGGLKVKQFLLDFEEKWGPGPS